MEVDYQSTAADDVAHALNLCLGKCAVAVVSLTNLSNLQVEVEDNSRADISTIFVQRLHALIREDDHLIELADDRVAVVLDNLIDIHHVQLAAMKMARIFEHPIEVGSKALIFDVYGGFLFVARNVALNTDMDQIMVNVESALNQAKNKGLPSEPFHIATLDNQQKVENHWQVGMRLREAMQAHQVYMDYQPKIDLTSGELVGAEALVRWRDNGVVVPPDDYLPALQNDLMWELTVYCFRRVLHDILDYGIKVPMAVNIDPTVLAQKELIPLLRRETSLWGVEPSQIILEITEVSEMFNAADARQTLTEISQLGFSISIDDFGAGHSNFQRLRDLPIDEIKIDRSFSGNLLDNSDNQTMTKNIINLARTLKMITVAEGIEDAETLALLSSWGCNIGQGFYLGAPLSIDNFTALCE